MPAARENSTIGMTTSERMERVTGEDGGIRDAVALKEFVDLMSTAEDVRVTSIVRLRSAWKFAISFEAFEREMIPHTLSYLLIFISPHSFCVDGLVRCVFIHSLSFHPLNDAQLQSRQTGANILSATRKDLLTEFLRTDGISKFKEWLQKASYASDQPLRPLRVALIKVGVSARASAIRSRKSFQHVHSFVYTDCHMSS